MNGPFGTQQFISEKKKEPIKALDAILLTVFQSFIYMNQNSQKTEKYLNLTPQTL